MKVVKRDNIEHFQARYFQSQPPRTCGFKKYWATISALLLYSLLF